MRAARRLTPMTPWVLGVLTVIPLVVVACGARGTGRLATAQPNSPTPAATPRTPTPISPAPTTAAGQRTGAASASLQIASVGNDLKFDKSKLTVAVGAQARLRLDNKATSAALQHNWVLVALGTEDAVAAAGLAAGPAKGWVPQGDPRVIAHTALIDGGKSGEVTFAAPPAGRYAFVCTFPGHAATMRGAFEVTS